MTINTSLSKPVVLCILDGWGERASSSDNAIVAARTPVMDRLKKSNPYAVLEASETFVGLPSGQMGNSEVGHMNLGAGRVVLQDLPRIDHAIADGSLQKSAKLQDFTQHLKRTGGTAHLMGLMSPGGVHSHQDHMIALAKYLQADGIPVAIHGFLDGRDTPPCSALGFIKSFQAAAPDLPITSLCGRYWAMDRDNRWERIRKAFDVIVDGKGMPATDPIAAVEASYANDVTDEFFEPVALNGYQGVKDGDGLLMTAFRADRAREILSALIDPNFAGFEAPRRPKFAAALGMVEYSETHNSFMETLFPAEVLTDVLGDVIAQAGGKQLRIAETEKYAHVTFFLNGGRETVFEGEDRVLIPSPDVATYDQKPEMSAPELTDKLVDAINSGRYDLIVVNYANTDMVGHTGVFEAAVAAAETVDSCIGRLETALLKCGGRMLITADHGNADMMVNPETGVPHTSHTLSQVPLILVGATEGEISGLNNGRLADVAPTLLDLMNLAQPRAMTGHSLLQRAARHAAE
ncbi:MAG: 2,3-bisphosphoglycerate-independent phosphoglycerate mutase [Alphaproteobacteria bacterium]|nr:2,3-bisphosphoglycerate-independent phosphoglycerate mutase [Alphaproteobacteria bacterium]